MKAHGAVSAGTVAELEAFSREHYVTEQVFRDLDRRGLRDYDVLWMDEYSLDIKVAWGGGVWLVYDTT